MSSIARATDEGDLLAAHPTVKPTSLVADEPDVTWPGKIPYFALSSGTSGASSKYIPVTADILRDMKKGSRRMFFDLAKYNLPPQQFTRHMLMVGSCTTLRAEGSHLTGDLSGILGLNRPLWMEAYYRPGKHITDQPEWRTHSPQ